MGIKKLAIGSEPNKSQLITLTIATPSFKKWTEDITEDIIITEFYIIDLTNNRVAIELFFPVSSNLQLPFKAFFEYCRAYITSSQLIYSSLLNFAKTWVDSEQQ